MIMQAQGALPHRPPPWPSTIQVVTPFNVPGPTRLSSPVPH